MTLLLQLEAYWQTYLATRGDLSPPPLDFDPIWHFGNLEVAGRVGQLVNAGIKTATSSPLWHLEQIGEPVPQVGACGIVADGAGTPICIPELTEVEIRPFNEVDAQFASDYGEYSRTLEQWRAASWEYFSEVCARIGREPSETMPMVCQRFRRVYPA
jgi:uncharacterized protein YhfF